ncbi:MAG TPA: zf-HC2 domain-containing protein [Acidimicrobiales bacterium]|nr:zf-HC2 domain-containing protein [Acidimicrobiales bacterium]
MTCTQVEQSATEYALGILPTEEARAVSAHILRCPDCRREVDDIRRVGDQLLDLIPDAEPPLGLDQRVLSAVRPQPTARPARPARRPVRRPGQMRLLVTGAAAAALIVIGAVTATTLSSPHHPAHPAELTAILREGNHNVGTIYVGGHPTWISMAVDHLSVTGKVSCQLVYRDGTVTDIGTFDLVDGSGTWGAPDPAGAAQPSGARLVGPAGEVLATASFSAE